MEIIHVLFVVFGFFAFSRAFLRWRESKISFGEFLFWAGIWFAGLVFAAFPGSLGKLSNVAGFRRGMDLVIAVSIVVIFYLMFRVYVKIQDTEQEITKLVREISFSKKK